MVSILPLIISFPGLFPRLLGNRSKSTNYYCYHCYLNVQHFFRFSGKILVFVNFFAFIFTLCSAGTANSTRWQVIFLLINTKWSLLVKIGCLFLIWNPRKCHESHFLGQIRVCINTICQNDQILISCTIPCRSPFPPTCVSFWIALVIVYSTRLLYNKLFHL